MGHWNYHYIPVTWTAACVYSKSVWHNKRQCQPLMLLVLTIIQSGFNFMQMLKEQEKEETAREGVHTTWSQTSES